MWDKMIKHAAGFPSAVLTGVDGDGFPFSVRCRPRLDQNAHVLHVDMPPGTPIQPGRACLLFHRHDDRLWNLKSFVVRGELVADQQGWFVRPSSFIPGMGIGGPLSFVRFVMGGRRAARRYLQKRGLPRPAIAWREISETMNGHPSEREQGRSS